MNKTVSILIGIFIASNPQSSFADWIELGAAARCDVERGNFSLVPVVQTSSEAYNVSVPPGYVAFDVKKNQNLKCNLDGVSINLVISIWGPSATGMGQGAGVIIIERLSIGKESVIPYRTNFLWQVSDERVLTRIEVQRVKEGYKTQYCYSDGFGGETPFQNMKCGDSIELN